MNKDKLKVSFEIDRYKVIGMLSRNCENAEEYNEIMDNLLAELKNRLEISIFLWRKSCASR